MMYFDYSATTKVDADVLDKFNELAIHAYANPNSNYKIAKDSLNIINDSTKIISDFFHVLPEEIIYTSGSSEANNLAIKGAVETRPNTQIITTNLEHSSVVTPLGYLQTKGYKISFVNLKENGEVDLDHLKELLKEETSLVTIGYVSSEVGIVQPLNEIGKLIKKYPGVIFHSDITQAVGKVNIDLTNVDLASFSAHKFYCFKGIGGLIKKNKINITPQIHGGRSVTNFRSGTPQTELIGAMAYAISKLNDNKYDYVLKLNNMIVDHLAKYPKVVINSLNTSIPHILNLSVLGVYSDDTQGYFANKEMYLSTKTACSSYGTYSQVVFDLTHSKERAESSIRISLSKYTTEEEVKSLLNEFDNYLGDL